MSSVNASSASEPARRLLWRAVLGLLVLTLAVAAPVIGADVPGEILLLAGESRVISGTEVSRVAVGEPGVADVRVLSPAEVLVNGKAEGQTTLLLWTTQGKVTETNIRVLRARAPLSDRDIADLLGEPRVKVREMSGYLVAEGLVTPAQRERITRLGALLGTQFLDLTEVPPSLAPEPSGAPPAAAPSPAERPVPDEPQPEDLAQFLRRVVGPGVAVEQDHGRTVLSGRVASEAVHQRVLQLAQAFYGRGLVDALSVEPISRLFQIKARLIEVDRQASRELGLEWPATLAVGEPAGPDGLPAGGWVRLEPLLVRLRALEESGRARMLAEPSMTVADGVEGAFLSGGQIPVPLETDGRVTIEWREYGIRLRVKPTLLPSGLVRLEARPEVSSLDWANGVRSAGSTVPALKTRWAETVIEQRSGDTLILAGLSLSEQSEHDGRLPGFADIPVLGSLARSGRGALKQTDLTILLTTTLQQPPPLPSGAAEPPPPNPAERPVSPSPREEVAGREPR